MTLKELLLGAGCVALAAGQAFAADPVVSSYVTSQPSTIILAQGEKGAPGRPADTAAAPRAARPRPRCGPDGAADDGRFQ